MIYHDSPLHAHKAARDAKLPLVTSDARQWWDATWCGVLVAGVIVVAAML